MAQLKLLKTTDGGRVTIIQSLAPKWKNFGDLLDFDAEGERLDLIEAKCGSNDPEACCREMFQHWLKGNGKPATWDTLLELLEDCDCKHLAEQIKLALGL